MYSFYYFQTLETQTKMRSIAFPALLVIGCYLAVANCEDHFSKDYSNSLNDFLEPNNNEVEDEGINNSKRGGEKYTYGLGRRAYSYAAGGNGIKRLPIYNFGLGKRARPYNFGLGKRSDDVEDVYSELDSSESVYPAGNGDNFEGSYS